jgi:ubiquinone/menaquinone biosynthesis C-methylase UbiE
MLAPHDKPDSGDGFDRRVRHAREAGMTDAAIDPEYLRYQYGDADKLRIRQETHRRYSERPDDFTPWLLEHLAPRPGLRLVDVGSGPGTMHPAIVARGTSIVATDASIGMAREATSGARRGALAVRVVQADARALPLADACCERVMANYMLYHVPDVPRALREMRRVLRPGGRVLLAYHAPGFMARLHAVHARAARELGYEPTRGMSTRFNLNDLQLVRSIFPRAERHFYEDALLFRTAEPALAYYASGVIDRIAGRPADGSHRGRLLPVVRAQVQAIVEREGAFRVPKTTGCFVAEG